MTGKTGNAVLADRMNAAGLMQHELAARLNEHIERLTGRPGTIQDRHIRNYLTGRTRWPHSRQRQALEEEFGCTAEELGFVPRQSSSSAAVRATPEDSVERRAFTTRAAVVAAGVVLPAARNSIGFSDVRRIDQALDALYQEENKLGGTSRIEAQFLGWMNHSLSLLNSGRASARVRALLYATAANAASTAAWAALDSHHQQRAAQHLERAVTLAGLSGDPEAVHRAWNNVAMLAGQRGRPIEALHAAQAARDSGMARRDPLYASHAHVRIALSHARIRDKQPALRALGHAEDALARTDPAHRPTWLAYYDRAELHGLAGIVHQRLGRPEEAEARTHQALARLSPELTRNRVYYTAQLALAQLDQGDIEAACATADRALTTAGTAPGSHRISSLLDDFRRRLATHPSPLAREWLRHTAEKETAE
ncbi:XRE family transcriptional regulator [Streptomyces sp. NPDC056192]|uniref:XRE family transcriptional regulator n=1 Tax=Streptomyces sp. NPDC056192 TaxID=3345743 RepID=UPI0035DC04AF